MTFTSTFFLLFLAIAIIFYYSVSSKKRWIVLLVASLLFYSSFSLRAFFYIIPTSIIVWKFARLIEKTQIENDQKISSVSDKIKRKEIKAVFARKKKFLLILSIVFTIGVLCVLKYTNFLLENITGLLSLFGVNFTCKFFNFFIPLGLSFYTFSAAGYLFDIYNEKYDAEKSLPRFTLFLIWFPSIIQGPINRFNQLHYEFFEKEHNFNLQNIQFASQRILWGFLKKLVIADRADQVVTYIFSSYESLPSFIILFGLIFYAIEIYADFAGGMDIALGVSELFGISLPENFRQPYFATSVADFWRRWHITLGQWMKDYVFFPISFSDKMTNISLKIASKNKFLARVFPACIGNIIIFLIVGIWHGAQWHYIFWGLYQGGIIAISTLLEPIYRKLIQFFHINENCFAWKIFRIIRTFLIILVGYILDEISDVHQMIGMAKQLFTFTNGTLISNFTYQGFTGLTLFTVLFFSAIWFIISVLKEKNIDVRKKISELALPLRWGIYLALILSIPFFQASDSIGFMYANF